MVVFLQFGSFDHADSAFPNAWRSHQTQRSIADHFFPARQGPAKLNTMMIESKIFLLMIAALLLAGSVEQWRRVRRAVGSRTWPSTQATIVVSGIAKDRVGTQHMRIYLPHVEYDYAVNNQTYRGKTFAEGIDKLVWFTGNPERARAWADRYPEGATVTIYYDPQCPKHACLERSRGNFILAYGIPLACLAGGLAIGFMIVMSLLPV